MRKKIILSSLLISSIPLLAANEIGQYEVDTTVKENHEVEFYDKSLNYEEALNNLQIVLIVDKSGSQQAPDSHPTKEAPGKGMYGQTWTQWDNTFYAAKYLAESLFEYDQDGEIPIIFFGHQANDCTTKSVGEMLVQFKKNKPTNETTNLLAAISSAFEKYSTPKSDSEKILFIVLTDGSPNQGQDPQIKSLIKEQIASRGLGDDKLNLLFVRIGDDPGAAEFLNSLDDSEEVGEYVDTKSDNMMHKMGPKNLILNAIFEHLDSQYQE